MEKILDRNAELIIFYPFKASGNFIFLFKPEFDFGEKDNFLVVLKNQKLQFTVYDNLSVNEIIDIGGFKTKKIKHKISCDYEMVPVVCNCGMGKMPLEPLENGHYYVEDLHYGPLFYQKIDTLEKSVIHFPGEVKRGEIPVKIFKNEVLKIVNRSFGFEYCDIH